MAKKKSAPKKASSPAPKKAAKKAAPAKKASAKSAPPKKAAAAKSSSAKKGAPAPKASGGSRSVDGVIKKFERDRSAKESQLAVLVKKLAELKAKASSIQQQIDDLLKQQSATQQSIAQLDAERDEEIGALLSLLGVTVSGPAAASVTTSSADEDDEDDSDIEGSDTEESEIEEESDSEDSDSEEETTDGDLDSLLGGL